MGDSAALQTFGCLGCPCVSHSRTCSLSCAEKSKGDLVLRESVREYHRSYVLRSLKGGICMSGGECGQGGDRK